MKPFDVVSSLFCGGASLLTSAFGLLLETGSRPAATRFLLSCQKKPWKEKARLAGGLSGGTRCALAALRSNSRRRFDYLFWAHATLARAWGGGVSAPPLMAVFGGGFNRHKLSFRKANEVSKYFLFLTINFSTCNRTSASDATICAQTVSSSTRKNVKNILFAAVLTPVALCFGLVSNASEITSAKALKATSAVVLPAMEKNQIPGMAVALVLDDKTYIFNYGVSDVAGQSPVTDETIFEIGSISKTFTATLATYAEAIGKLKLTDTVAKYLPELAGTDFGNLQLLNLGTHTVGGIPLQVPDEVQNKEQLLEYFRSWKPVYKTGTMRTYANPSIGALGWVAAKSLDKDFNTAMTQTMNRTGFRGGSTPERIES